MSETNIQKGFVLYYSLAQQVALLDDAQTSALFRAILSTGSDAIARPELDLPTTLVFISVERELAENAKKWEASRQARVDRARKGGQARAEKAARQRAAEEGRNSADASLAQLDQLREPVDVDINVDIDVEGDVENIDKHTHPAPASAEEGCAAGAAPFSLSPIPLDQSPQADAEPRSTQATRQAIDQYFEAVWQTWPHKRGKSRISRQTKRKLYETVSVDEMRRAIARYVQDVEMTPNRPWMLGDTWFQQGRYVDYLDKNYTPPPPVTKPAMKTSPGRYVSKEGPRDFSDLEE